MKPKVSIIMPVYNSERTLERALDSFRNQTFADWELIAVNDGSSDESLEILNDYANRDSRIIVIDKPNGGVASARQCGIEHMRGDYSIHADSDDWVEADMLQELLSIAARENADIVICDYFVDSENSCKTVSQRPTTLNPIDVLYDIYSKKLFGGLWHKLIRNKVYESTGAKFIAGINYCEDQLLLTQILSCRDLKIKYLNKSFYHYVLNDNSITRAVTQKSFESLKRFTEIFPTFIPIEQNRFRKLVDNSRLDLFVVAFVNNLYDRETLLSEFAKIKHLAYRTKSIRWKLGYFCISNGLLELAHKFIRY